MFKKLFKFVMNTLTLVSLIQAAIGLGELIKELRNHFLENLRAQRS